MTFSSTTTCRDPGEFVEQLQRRTGRLRAASPGESALTFQIALTATPAGIEGELRVQEAEDAAAVRQVPGVDCHEVISAMALIGALMVDPLAAAVAPPSPPRQRTTPPPPPPLPPAPPPEPSPWRFAFGQRVGLDTGVAPDPTVSGALVVEIGHAMAGPWLPTVRLAARTALATEASAGDLGSARFNWNAGRVSACPVRVEPSARLAVVPCAAFELGWVHAQGFDTLDPRPATVMVPRLGAELAAALRLVGPLTLGGEVAVLGNLAGSERFFFLPIGALDSTVYELPSVGISMGLGLGLSFF